jgi:hypothetical protein
MSLIELKDWTNRDIKAIRSKGGVFAFPDFSDNLIHCGDGPWPPPEILQKLYKSEKLWAFPEEDQGTLAQKLGYYCDLQSIHSEDAMQWSYFGPLIYGTSEDRTRFARWLHARLSLSCLPPTSCAMAIWQRIPHPETGTANGPELDLLMCADTFVLFVESKWRSGEGRWQGVDGTATQVQLRQRFLARFGKSLFGNAHLAVMYVVLDDSQRSSGDLTISVPVVSIRWTDLCDFSQHPRAEEIRRYYDWKRNLVVRKFGMAAPG